MCELEGNSEFYSRTKTWLSITMCDVLNSSVWVTYTHLQPIRMQDAGWEETFRNKRKIRVWYSSSECINTHIQTRFTTCVSWSPMPNTIPMQINLTNYRTDDPCWVLFGFIPLSGIHFLGIGRNATSRSTGPVTARMKDENVFNCFWCKDSCCLTLVLVFISCFVTVLARV